MRTPKILPGLAIAFAMMLLGGQSLAADFVGDEVCGSCHQGKAAELDQNIHSKQSLWDASAGGCESCHGAGGDHAASADPAKILNPAKLDAETASAQCLTCHDGDRKRAYWQGSSHEASDVSCVACHNTHDSNSGMLTKTTEQETCFGCHAEQRALSQKRSSHTVRDVSHADGAGSMTCSDCHNPHGTQSDSLIDANTTNDKCYECHIEKKAPVLWEHSPVKEDCLSCHNAHGSNHEYMLNAKRPRLCHQCHAQGRHQTVAGEGGSYINTNRGCSNCHAQVHGTNLTSGVKLKR